MANRKYQKKSEQRTINVRRERDAWPKKELLLLEPRTLLVIIVTSILTLLVAFFGEKGAKFLTSVLTPVPEHAPYDGTVSPVKQVPNWVKLSESERKASYSTLPQEKLISLPSYNPSRLALPVDSLKWNDSNDDAIRNEKITYSVPYLGSYKLDGLEGSGSHPAVDIKIPMGTPIYAIANGTVIKAEVGSGGFGNHIVIQHNNFPSVDDPAAKTTLFSSYSHMDTLGVKALDVVTKGQLIGYSGQSGTATTPHLHFQIDSSEAPWHPYWPFNGADMKAAGYTFFQAINNGLRQDNAIKFTISPMRYVQKYFGEGTLVATVAEVPREERPAAPDPADSISFGIQIAGGTQFTEGSSLTLVIQAFEPSGNLISKPDFKDEVSVSLLNGNGQLNKEKLNAADFESGIVQGVTVDQLKAGTEKVIVRFRMREVSSQEITITAQAPVKPVPNSATTESAATLPEGAAEVGSSTESAGSTSEPPAHLALPPFIDVALDSPYFEALTELKKLNLVSGYSDGSFKPGKEVSRAEAIAFILRAIEEQIRENIGSQFPDVGREAWYFKFVATAFELGFVKGYPDGYFRPDATVNLAEFLTMLFVGAKTDVDPQITITLPEGVAASNWFAPYVQEAISRGLIEVKDNKLDAATPMTRGELSKILWKLKQKF